MDIVRWDVYASHKDSFKRRHPQPQVEGYANAQEWIDWLTTCIEED